MIKFQNMYYSIFSIFVILNNRAQLWFQVGKGVGQDMAHMARFLYFVGGTGMGAPPPSLSTKLV